MDVLATIVVRRTGRLHLPPASPDPPGDGEAWVRSFETDLVERGWMLSADVRRRLTTLDRPDRDRWADWVLAIADQAAGAHRIHVPLFRSFPDTPTNPDALFIDRMLAHMFQEAGVPCVLCGRQDEVVPVDPCGHLVCGACFDPNAYSACPICGRRTAGFGFLDVPAPRLGRGALRTTVLHLGVDRAADAVVLRDLLVARPGALNPADQQDLRVLVENTEPTDLGWLPEEVPSRQTLGLVGAWAMQLAVLPVDAARVLSQLVGRWATATDIARTLWCYSGGDPGLDLPSPPEAGPNDEWRPEGEPKVVVPTVRVRALPRPLRRCVLDRINDFGVAVCAEDLHRNPTVWKRLAERLHPYEYVQTYPAAAVAFATLRGTRVAPASALGAAMLDSHAGDPLRLELVNHDDGRISVRVRTFASAVEQALERGDATGAAHLLVARPGEFWRRLDHVLRKAGGEEDMWGPVIEAARRVAPHVSPAVLAGAASALKDRENTVAAVAVRPEASAVRKEMSETLGRKRGTDTTTQARRRPSHDAPAPGTPRRVFFPRGNVAKSWTAPENRAPLPASAVDRARRIVDVELVARAALLDRFDVAVIDARLVDVPAPLRERAGSAQLAGWPRGARIPLADSPVLRLFLHWVDFGATRVDLDLSCAFYRDDWSHLGHCDYTTLRFSNEAAVHSGDLTSAPAPIGATEYLDLQLASLEAGGARWAIPVVFSYNDVPFEVLPEAFAGFSIPQTRDAHFDPATVVQRFDLRGDALVLVPMVVDLSARQLLWVDINVSSAGYGHAAARHGKNLGRLGADLWDHFAEMRRPTLFDVAAWHAVGRADRVVVLHKDGSQTEVAVVGAEARVAAVRAMATVKSGSLRTPLEAGPIFLALLDGEAASEFCAEPAAGSVVMAVTGQAPAGYAYLSPADSLAGLVPSL